ncbi:hypothetical protein VTO42DRAFT_7236 [Malbranchea cinnamomea]
MTCFLPPLTPVQTCPLSYLPSTNLICRFWLRGVRSRGLLCRFQHRRSKASKSEKSILADTGPLLERIDSRDLAKNVSVTDSTQVTLSGYEFLSSYNWADKEAPTIYVPGAPPAFKSKQLPFHVTKDQGAFFVDQNTFRCSRYPAEALFRSLAVMQPNLDMRDIDLVTDRNNLRKLLHFVSQTVDRSFRIDVKFHGGVVFFSRWEPELRQTILSGQNLGFGHGFEREVTAFDEEISDSTAHHRVVRYSLGGIRCLVRYEADAYWEGNGEERGGKGPVVGNEGDPGETDGQIGREEADGVLDSFESMRAATPEDTQVASVKVLHRGRLVPPSAVAELKTRAIYRTFDLKTAIPQLWFAQTPNILVGYHYKGQFKKIQKISVKPKFQKWEKENKRDLRKLVCLIEKIMELSRQSYDRGYIVVCEVDDPFHLRIYESQKGGKVLPEDIINQYEWPCE